jgi:hypothetical protein
VEFGKGTKSLISLDMDSLFCAYDDDSVIFVLNWYVHYKMYLDKFHTRNLSYISSLDLQIGTAFGSVSKLS